MHGAFFNSGASYSGCYHSSLIQSNVPLNEGTIHTSCFTLSLSTTFSCSWLVQLWNAPLTNSVTCIFNSLSYADAGSNLHTRETQSNSHRMFLTQTAFQQNHSLQHLMSDYMLQNIPLSFPTFQSQIELYLQANFRTVQGKLTTAPNLEALFQVHVWMAP